MIFYGWNHVVQKVMGKFQGSQCSLCEQSITYQLIRLRTYITIFFMPIICYKTKYVARCSCGYKKQLTKQEANDILDLQLPKSKKMMQIGNVLKFTAALLVVGFIALVIIAPEDESVNKNISNVLLSVDGVVEMIEEDGEYLVYDTDGKIVADITAKDDVKRVNNFYEYHKVTEDVPEGHEFTEMHYFYERNKDELAYSEDRSVVTRDENLVGIRYYEFEEYDETHYWYFGMNDFNNIVYKEDRIVYPMQHPISETDIEYYSKVYIQEGEYEIVMIFFHGTNKRDQNVLTSLDFIKNDSVNKNQEYIEYYQELDLTMDSTIDEIINYIKNNKIEHDVRHYKEYYDEIEGVVLYREYDYMQNGQWRQVKLNYEVTQQDNGYYVAKLIE